MPLETPRLTLREYTPEDFAALREILSDPETMRFYPRPYDDAGVRRWLDWCVQCYADLGFGLWAMCLPDSGELIGDCGISIQNIHGAYRPEVGYHVRRDHWRRGYAAEAARACRDWAFENTPFQRLYSYMNAENVASRGVAWKNGMRWIEDYMERDGVLHSVYAITRGEWAALPR